MKKLLLIAILMLALVFTVVACTTEKTPEGTTAGETTATPGPQETEPQATEPQATEPQATEPQATEPQATEPQATEPQETEPQETEPQETEPQETEEVTTADPMLPVNVFDAEAIKTLTGQNGIESAEVVDGVLHVVPNTADPYWYPFANVDGARYVVIRYRSADATGADIQFYLGSTGAGPSDDSSMLRMPAIVDGEWHLAIFDTQSLIDAGKYDGSTVSYFRFDPLEAGYMLDENGEPYKPDGQNFARYDLPAGCSIDIDYIGFFHSEEAAIAYDCAPGYLTTPEDLLTRFNEGAGTAVNQVGSAEIMTEGGASFVRLTANGGDPYICAVPFGQSIAAPYYMGIAYRTNSALEGHFFIGSTGGWSGAGDFFSVTWEEGGWTYQVIDLTATGVTTLDLENPVLNYCRMDFFGSQPAEGEYFDVAFVGFFESANDATAYCELNGLQLKDIKNTFVADVNVNEIGTGLNASDLKNYFTVELPVGSEGVVANGEGKMYSMTAISNMFADVAGKYFIKANNLTADKGFMFVRGYKVVNSDEIIEKFDPAAGFYKINNYFETDTVGKMGGAGIYAAIENGSLTIMVKYYNAEAITRVGNKMYTLPVDGTELIMADNGDVVSIIVNGKLCATIALSGSVAYADINEVSPAGNFAASAVVTLADGTTETIENTLIADTCVCQVGVVTRGGHFRFDALEVGAFSAIEIPSFPEAPSNEIAVEITDNNCWIDIVEFTATATGNYTFNLPAGLGAFDVDACDAWPPVEGPYVDYNDNVDGASFTIGLTEGETTTFYIAHATKGEYVITYDFAEGEVGGDDEPEAPAETILNIGENTIAVTDEIIAEGGVAYALTVTEAGNYTFEGDFSAIILDADGNMVGRGMASLEAGTYTINLSTMVITEAGNYNVNVVYTAPDAE